MAGRCGRSSGASSQRDPVRVDSKHTGRGASSQDLIVRLLSGELDDRALHGADEPERDRLGGRPGGERSGSTARADEARAALHEALGDPLEATPDRVILTAELEPQRDRHPSDVSAAVDGVPARQGDQGCQRIGFLLDGLSDLLSPGLVNPIDDRQGEVLFVLELVIKRAAGVAGVARDPLQREVAVSVPRETPRGGFEQRAARARAAVGLGRPPTRNGPWTTYM